jgi:plastocyanin
MRPLSLLLSAVFLGVQPIPGAPQSGTVSGRVEMKAIPPRTAVSRYPSPGGPLQRVIDSIPTVVFIDGPVAGAPGWPKPFTTVIAQKGLSFSPSLLVIPRGTSVSFPNEDNEFHNVFSYSRTKRFDLGRYPKGESKSVTFVKPGIVKAYCEVHPWMRAAILVLESPCYAIASGDGLFSIDGIPAGRYELVAWNIDAGSRKVVVDVTAGRTLELEIRLSGGFEAASLEQEIRLDMPAGGNSGPADALPKGVCCAGSR